MELLTAPNTVRTPAENFTGEVYPDPIFNGDGTSWLEPVTDEQYAAAAGSA